MSASQPAHLFVAGARQRDRVHAMTSLPVPPPLLDVVSAHRRLRGPYTAAVALLRAVVPSAVTDHPELVAAHEIELLTVAPELSELVPATKETLTALAVPEERTRFYSKLRTLRLAHGLTEFLRDLLVASGPRSLLVDALHEADPTDREFVAVLLRRIDPALLTVVVGGPEALLVPAPLPPEIEPGTPAPEDLALALDRHALRVDAAPVPAGTSTEDLATRYVAGDCTDDDPCAVAAYDALPEDRRRALHDARAEELVQLGERSHVRGALPYHREHGGDPLGGGAEALTEGMDECMRLGFYDATLDFCARGRTLAPWHERPDLWWTFTSKMPTSLSALGRAEEAEAICDEARANTVNPHIHIQCAYATSMLYTRHREPRRRDHERALAWINEAIAISELLPDPKLRAFNTVFHHNGLALIEAHRRRPERALELVTEGIAELDRQLGPDEHHLHRSVLRYNRAQVLVGLGRLEEALADYRAVAEVDPYYPEYHFDLGNLLRRLGRDDEALAEYETTMRLGPPFPEPYYNRGDIRLAEGDEDGALADFDYVLELDPGFVPAYVNRAGVLLDRGEHDRAERDALAGLEIDPESTHLHAVLGHVHAERGDHAAARAAFDRALAIDPTLVPALAGRAASWCESGDPHAALADLGRAVELVPDDPALLFNRAHVLRETGQPARALADLDAAATLAPGDEDIEAAMRRCRADLAADLATA